MTNTEISDNNPEKELIIDKSISDDKTKQISNKNTTQNKKFTPKNTKEIILDAGHCPHDEIPELVNQHILDWVDSL